MITIDIGNTAVTFGRFNKDKLREVYWLSREDLSRKNVNNIFSKLKKNEPLIICSVSPEVNSLFLGSKKKTYLVGKNLKVPIKCQYDKKKVGADRLVAAYAARKIEPSTRIIIDFGTAITVDFLSKKGAYQGGIILPGINSTLKTFQNCSLLPDQVKIKKANRLIPKTTSESINKGLQEGFSFMLNGLIASYQKRLKLSSKDKIFLTGGDAFLLRTRLKFKFHYEKHLVLKGLFYLACQTIDF